MGIDGGGFFGGVASGMETAAKGRREDRELGIREDALKNTQKRELSAEVDKNINGTMLIVAKTIEESRKAGAPPDKVMRAVQPLLQDIAGLAKNAGRDPGIYARQAEALLTIPKAAEKPPGMESPMGKFLADIALARKQGVDPEVIRMMEMRFKRDAEGTPPRENAFANEHQLRAELKPHEKVFAETDSAYRRILAVTKAPSTAGDMAVIYNFVKMADPGAQVTESEFKNAERAKPLLDGLLPKFGMEWKDVEAAWTGKGLGTTQRQDFLNQAKRLHGVAVTKFDEKKNEYRTLAKKYDLDPERIVSAPQPPVSGARQAPDGNWYIEKGGKFFRVEP